MMPSHEDDVEGTTSSAVDAFVARAQQVVQELDLLVADLKALFPQQDVQQ